MKATLLTFAKSLGIVILGAVLTGVAAYATGHEAQNPALYGAIVVAIMEARVYLKSRGVAVPVAPAK